MQVTKLIFIFIVAMLLNACGNSEKSSASNEAKETPSTLFKTHKKVLDDAKELNNVLADKEQKTKDKLKDL